MRCALAPLFIMQIIHPFMPPCKTTITLKPYVPGMAEAMGCSHFFYIVSLSQQAPALGLTSR